MRSLGPIPYPMRCQRVSQALPYGGIAALVLLCITSCISVGIVNMIIILNIRNLSPCFSLNIGLVALFSSMVLSLIFHLSRAYPRHLTSRSSYMGSTIRYVLRHASAVMEERPCLRGHAAHHHGEYPPASWRVAVCEAIRQKHIANKHTGVRCGQHSSDHRRHRRTRLRRPYQCASLANDDHQDVPQ
jgi:hypothetical protein